MAIYVPESVLSAFRDEWLPLVERLRQGTATPLPHDRVLAARIAEAFVDGMNVLVPLADDDPAWKGSLYEKDPGLGDLFVKYCLHDALTADPNDDVARWLAIALDLYFGDNDFALALLEPLIERDVAQLRWLVAGALWVLDISGVNTSDALRRALVRLSRHVPGFERKVRGLSGAADAHVRSMANVALAVMRGESLLNVSRGNDGSAG